MGGEEGDEGEEEEGGGGEGGDGGDRVPPEVGRLVVAASPRRRCRHRRPVGED